MMEFGVSQKRGYTKIAYKRFGQQPHEYLADYCSNRTRGLSE